MILSLCTLALIGTAAAQSTLFSFARSKMTENHDLSLTQTQTHAKCSYSKL